MFRPTKSRLYPSGQRFQTRTYGRWDDMEGWQRGRDLLEHLRRLVSQWHPVLMSLNLPISGPQTRQSLKRWRQNGAGGGPRWRSKWRRPDVNVAEGGQTDSRPADPREILQHSHHVVSCLLAHFLFVQKFRLCLMGICSSTKSSAVSCAKHLYAHYWLHPLDRLW